MTIFSIVLIVTAMLLDSSLKQLRIAESRMGQFQEAQAAFESMARRLAGCELNPYYDFVYPGNDTSKVPTSFALQSELHFVSGPARTGAQALFTSGTHPTHGVFFHGAYGLTDSTNWKTMGNLLNSWGYYLEFGNDSADRAVFLTNSSAVPPHFRFRLKELQVSAEQVRTYGDNLPQQTSTTQMFQWFRNLAAASPSSGRTIAENVVALVINPLESDPNTGTNTNLSPDYYYDTRAFQYASTIPQARLDRMRHRLPPILRITLVALDEVSAQKLETANGTAAPDLGLTGIFTDATKYDNDLATLTSNLQNRKLDYRVFTTTVRLRNSRWTGTY